MTIELGGRVRYGTAYASSSVSGTPMMPLLERLNGDLSREIIGKRGAGIPWRP